MAEYVTQGGVQLATPIAPQIVYLDFDGELTSYNGEILTVDNVEVQDSSLTEERIANIIAELNEKYVSQNVIFVTERPETAEYSTIYIGKTSAFDAYGSFAGLAETIDFDNKNKTDKAFVMLDSSASDEAIISTISHETDHLTGRLDHGGEELKSYASYISGNNTIYVDGGHTQNGWPAVLNTDYTGVVFPAPEVTVGAGGIARNIVTVTNVYSGGPVNGGATRTIDYELTVLTYGSAYDCVFQGGSMTIEAGAYVHNLSLLLPDSLATMGYTRYQISPNAIFDGEIWVGKHILLNYVKLQSGAELHINAGGTVSSPVISGLSTKLFVYSGGVAKNVNLIAGAKLYVESGGSADLIYDPFESFGTITVMPGAIVTTHTYPVYYGNKQSGLISYGSTIDNVTVGSEYKLYVSNGGVANSTSVNSGGYLYVSSGGSASNITALDGAHLDIHVASNTYIQGTYGGSDFEMKDARISGYTVNSNGHLHVSNGGVANSTTVNSNGYLYVYNGGVANSTTVNSGGDLGVYNGGVANSTSVNSNGHLHVLNGGVANSTTVRGGYFHVYNGGVANSTTVNSNGRLYVSNGGVANFTTVNSGGYLSAGGSALNIVENGGYVEITEGANATFTPNTIFGLILNQESATLHSGTVANETTANFYGRLYVSNGGVANSTTVNTEGYLRVSSGGVANSTTVNSGGYLYVYNGGVANSTTVNTEGYLRVSSGGVANSTSVNFGGYLRVSSGGVHRGTLQIANGATVSAYTGAVIDFTVADRTTADGYLINNFDRLTGTPTYTITVSADLASGTYKLAQGAENFTGSITVGDGMGDYGSITVNGDDLVYNDITYSLDQVDGNLTLTISGVDLIPPEKPIAIPSTTEITNKDVSVSVTYSADSIIKQYKIGKNGQWVDYTNTFTVTSNNTIYFRAEDAAGNESTSELVIANIDNFSPANPIATPDIISVTNQNVTVYATFSNDTVVKEYSLDNKVWNTYTSGVVMTDNGPVYFRGRDAAGNYSDVTSYEVTNIDKVAPIAPTASADITNITNQDVTVSATFSSDSVCKEYSLDNKTWLTYTNEIKFNKNGIVYFRGTDEAGNVSVVTCYDITNIDKDAPVKPTAFADITSVTNQDVTVSATFSNDTVIREYSLDNKTWQTYTSGIEFEQNGIVYFRGTDEAGNVSDVTIYQVSNIDKVAPTLKLTADVTTPTNGDVILTASVSDGKVEYFNEKWISGNTFTVTENGTYKFRVTDEAGNVTEKSIDVTNIDKVAPVLPAEFNVTVSGYNTTLDWSDAVDTGISDIKGYYVRYGTSETLTGEGRFITVSEFNLTELAVGTYYYQIKAADKVGNITAWSALQTFEIKPGEIQNPQSSSDGVSWDAIPGLKEYDITYSTSDFASTLKITAPTNAIDTYGMPAGTYQWQVSTDENAHYQGDNIVSDNLAAAPQKFVSDADGNMDVFFANANEIWESKYAAQHNGILNGWKGTQEQIALEGKNQLCDIFAGSSDANILVMTDDANGDALFVDDIYTALPGTVAEQQARIAQIDEIRAGLGDDIVDMTSQRFEYVGDGVKIYGGLGNDTIWSNNGNNILFGDAGNDRIVGGGNNDVIIGGSGNDSMHGGGGNDIFTFGENWGKDTIEQLSGGSVTLWFESGSESNWNADILTYTDGANSVKISGITADQVTLKFGDVDTAVAGAFLDAASEKIFEDKNKGMIA